MFIGAQVSLYPMTSDFVDVILSGLEALSPYRERLRIETDDISTLMVGAPKAIATLMDEGASAPARVEVAAKLLNGVAKVLEQHWPQIAPYRHVLSLALTGVEAGKVAMLFVGDHPPRTG